jgi:drug/metabolite transporter (DMT)-like permease
MDRRTQGILLITLSTVAFSSAGFFTRLIHLDAWTMLFWRGTFAGPMILCIIIAQERDRAAAVIRGMGWPGLVAALCSTTATIMYINALRHTSVADVAVLFAAAPFLTAGLGWLWFGVTETWATLIASLAALLGVAIMVGGAASQGHMLGDILGLGMTACMAIMMLIIRQHHDTPMLPAACLSALLCPLLVWPLTTFGDIGGGDMFYLFLFGTMQFGLGLALLTIGGQLVSATENALLNTLETPMAVAWVWLCFDEVPSITSVVGGAIVVAAIVGHIWNGSRRRISASVSEPSAARQ